jgi:hypothetical protein
MVRYRDRDVHERTSREHDYHRKRHRNQTVFPYDLETFTNNFQLDGHWIPLQLRHLFLPTILPVVQIIAFLYQKSIYT